MAKASIFIRQSYCSFQKMTKNEGEGPDLQCIGVSKVFPRSLVILLRFIVSYLHVVRFVFVGRMCDTYVNRIVALELIRWMIFLSIKKPHCTEGDTVLYCIWKIHWKRNFSLFYWKRCGHPPGWTEIPKVSWLWGTNYSDEKLVLIYQEWDLKLEAIFQSVDANAWV